MKLSIFSKNKSLFWETKRSGGFTLVELMVVMAIASTMMTVLVIQQSKWNDSLIVSTQAYEMALMIRQAQIYSLGVKEHTAGSGDKFDVGYGIYFEEGNTTSYVFFADVDGNKKYDGDPPDDVVEMIDLKRNVVISDVCGVSKCFFSGGGPLQKASIVFHRPETKANIMLTNFGGTEKDDPTLTVKLKSPKGQEYFVKVEASGEVSTGPV